MLVYILFTEIHSLKSFYFFKLPSAWFYSFIQDVAMIGKLPIVAYYDLITVIKAMSSRRGAWNIVNHYYLRVLHKSPWYPATHPVEHVPLILEHWSTSRHCPHVSLQLLPNDPLSQAGEKRIVIEYCFHTKNICLPFSPRFTIWGKFNNEKKNDGR